jgi:two-component system phosphate regulon sensor histidine kinase PhoR
MVPRGLGSVVFIVLAGFGAGFIVGYPLVGLSAGLALSLALMTRRLVQLQAWLSTRDPLDIPEASGVWGAIFDNIRKLIKESSRREDQLKEALTRFQSANAASPDAIVILSPRNEIEWANPAAAPLLNIHYPQDRRSRIMNLLRDPAFMEYLEHGDYTDALQMAAPRAEKELSVRITPFGSLQKLITARDTTRLAQLEVMRRNFIANISHELRTPLTVVTGFVETLRDLEGDARPDIARHLATMHEQTIRMQRLVDDLLLLSRLETSPPPPSETPVNVGALLESLKRTGEILSGEHRHVITVAADPNLKLLGNEEELRSAFSNLVNNAVRYTPDGGRIQIIFQATAGGAEVSVADNGEGIAAQHLPHLTERFYRVDNARSRATGGTGLGLSIVKHILLRHEAVLRIESTIGQGSTFTCVFPAHRVVRGSAEIIPLRA